MKGDFKMKTSLLDSEENNIRKKSKQNKNLNTDCIQLSVISSVYANEGTAVSYRKSVTNPRTVMDSVEKNRNTYDLSLIHI